MNRGKHVINKITAFLLCIAVLFTTVTPPLTTQAVSGNFTGGQVCTGYRLKIVYSESEKDSKENTSRVKAVLYLVQDAGYDLYIGTRTATITINGEKKTISDIPAIRNTGGVTTKLGSASTTVKHKADGTKSVTIAATFDMKATLAGTYFGTMSASKKVELAQLNREAPTVTLKCNSVTAGSVTLTATADMKCDNWQYSKDNGSTWTSFGSNEKSNTFTVSNLKGGTKYTFIARARRICNYVRSANSSAVSATTKPAPPGGLTVSSITKNSAKFSWNAVTGASSYKVYLNGTAKSTGIKTTSYSFTGLTPNTTYKFGVCAVGTSGDSTLSQTAQKLTLPGAPSDLTVTGQTDESVSLSWGYDAGGNASETTFEICRDGVVIGTTSDTSYTDTAYGNTDSSYTVCAVTSAGKSTQTDPVLAEHVPLGISLNVTDHETYAVITPVFTGGLNREIDEDSLKWTYGSQNTDFFADGGSAFTDSFAVLQNGTYTVCAKDTDGNEAVATVTVTGIFCLPEREAFVHTVSDLSVDGAGISAVFERTYNSMDDTAGILGKGWSFSYAKKTCISEADETVRLVYLPDGTAEYFRITDDGYAGIRTQDRLSADGENTLILTTKDRTVYTYKNDILTEIRDANGNTVTITLNAKGNPETITDSTGRIYTLSYDAGRLKSITDPAGRVVSYTYDEDGNLIKTLQADQKTETYEYDDGLLAKVSSGQADTIRIFYDGRRMVKTVTEESAVTYAYQITRNGELVVTTAEKGSQEDTDGETTQTYHPFGDVILDAEGYLYEYNTDGTVHKIDGADTDHTLVIYTYDEKGNVRTVKTQSFEADETEDESADAFADGKITENITYDYTYADGTDHILSVTEETTTYTYDEDGTLTETDTETVTGNYDEAGNLLSETTVYKGKTETAVYTYDNRGLVLSETADGVTTEYGYDTNGYETYIKTVEEEKETVVSYAYNVIGQVVTQTENGLITDYVYDLSGNAVKTIQSDGTVTHISRVVYDSDNRIIQKISDPQYSKADDGLTPDDNRISAVNVYHNENVGERYTYDNKGNITTYVNTAGNKTVNTYDSKDRLVKTVTCETAEDTTDDLTTRYVYDTEGNLIQTVYPHQYRAENDSLDVSAGINSYADHAVGERVTSVTDDNGIKTETYTDSFGKETINTYDKDNHLVKSVTDGHVTRYVYNDKENLVQVIYPDLYKAEDDRLNLASETPVDDYADQMIGDRYTYDEDGKVLTYTNRYGEVTTNTYDEDGSLTSVAKTKADGTVFTYDDENRAEKETYANGLVREYTYASDHTTVTGSNHVTAVYTQNAFGDITEYTLKNGDSSKKYTYTYDSDGNITTISLNGSLQQTFIYNLSGELIRVDDKTADETVTYEYDYVGNITKVQTYDYTTGKPGTPKTTKGYTYNSQNQRTDLSYNANGNAASLNGYTFGWTNRRLTSATSTDNSISYTYNYAGIRTGKTVNGNTTYYEVDENNNVTKQYELVDGAETNLIEFVYDSSSAPLYMVYNDNTYYYEKNLQGDITALLDREGSVVAEYTYDIWGRLLGITGELADSVGTANPLRYRGYYYDTETELYYLQSRYYSPEQMRFLSQDEPAYSNAQGEPLGSNLYAYCLNNPVILSDENGCWIIVSVNPLKNTYYYLRFGVALYNYKYNSKKVNDISGVLINGQGEGKVAKLRFGAFRMSYNGCEVIAIYNAFLLLGKGKPISKLAFELEVNGASRLFGVLGSNPYFLDRCFLAHCIKFKRYITVKKMQKNLQDNGVYIISFWNKKNISGGLHTVAVWYHEGVFTVHNRWNYDTKSQNFSLIQDIFKDGRFIIGYYLGEKK